MKSDPTAIMRELEWLKDNPAFEERPASITEFLGEDYLNIEGKIRPGLRDALVEIFGEDVTGEKISRVSRAMVTGAIGIGKQLRPTEPVLTPGGWVPIALVSEGDEVVGKDGLPHKVTGVYRQTNVQMYRIHFRDGTSIDAGDEHLWEVQESVTRRISKTRKTERVLTTRVMSTEELYNEPLKQGSSYRFRIPLVSPVEFESEVLPIHPWLLGALISNGSLTKTTPTVATEDEWIYEKIKNILPGFQVKYYDRRVAISYGSLRRKDSNPLAAAISLLKLNVRSKEKFIPRQYLFGSSTDRLELLRGLMDNDGSSFGNNSSSYSTSSQQLTFDVADLVRSLGGYCTVTSFERSGVMEYQVHVNMDQVCPFSLPRKVKRWKPRINQRPARSIVDIKKIDISDGICIAVDAPDQLYVTSNYIVTHNTTLSSIALPYMAHWVLCLKDPQDFFGLLPGSRIAFMQMSTSEKQALEVVFGDIFARIKHSKWFIENYPYDDKFTKQIRFPKEIWILPGDSAETTFEGYNILGGILDEMDSHKVTNDKDYADVGYDTINSRIESRFGNKGLIILIGQMKKASGFAARKYNEFLDDKDAHVTRMTIWESFGWQNFLRPDGSRDSFFYDRKRKQIIPSAVASIVHNPDILEIPNTYIKSFKNNPEKALRDLAGIPPATEDPFISLVHKIELCRDKYVERVGSDSPVDDNPVRPQFADWFKAENDPRKRTVHIDMATSGDGDALGLAMGHVESVVEIDEEMKPYIVIDCLFRVKAASGTEIMLSDIRRIIYHLRDDLKFRIKSVTLDGFQSTDTMQQLRKRKFFVDYVSVDRSTLPYEDLREAIYEERIEFPKYLTYLQKGADHRVEIAVKELMELQDTGKKIDHPKGGSKDIADAVAGVTYTLMGDRQYRRGVTSLSDYRERRNEATGTTGKGMDIAVPYGNVAGLRAPVPPHTSGGLLGLSIPDRLKPGR